MPHPAGMRVSAIQPYADALQKKRPGGNVPPGLCRGCSTAGLPRTEWHARSQVSHQLGEAEKTADRPSRLAGSRKRRPIMCPPLVFKGLLHLPQFSIPWIRERNRGLRPVDIQTNVMRPIRQSRRLRHGCFTWCWAIFSRTEHSSNSEITNIQNCMFVC